MPIIPVVIKAILAKTLKKGLSIAATSAVQEAAKKAVDNFELPDRKKKAIQKISNHVKRRRKERQKQKAKTKK